MNIDIVVRVSRWGACDENDNEIWIRADCIEVVTPRYTVTGVREGLPRIHSVWWRPWQ